METPGFKELKVLYEACSFAISDFKVEAESQEYGACKFQLNGLRVVYRNAKTTPKKVGQFVTCWKRNEKGPIEPFSELDSFDLLVINVSTNNHHGQFVFPKLVLAQKRILSTQTKAGKRGFRVYPLWDKTTVGQARSTQKWQLDYFLLTGDHLNLVEAKRLYKV